MKYAGRDSATHINWLQAPTPGGEIRYLVSYGPNDAGLSRFDTGSDARIGGFATPAENQWQFLEISFFDGQVSLYQNGEEGIIWTDPQPWGGGSIDLEPYPGEDGYFYFDDLVVCELSQPFATLPKPETGINLALNVVDAEGAPVAGAMASVAEMGAQSGATQTTDESGMASWNDLPGLSATLVVNAPGYASVEQSLTLEKGDNQTTVTVELQPHGLLLSDACRPEEKLLYIEDLQDGSAQGWNEIDLQVPGWSIEAAPDAPENQVIAAREGGAR